MENDNAGRLYTALHRLGRQIHRSAHWLGHRDGCYREQSRLLLLIAENDGVIQRDLAEDMDVRPSSMTEMLGRMEQMGLIYRRQDEKDQRVMHIFLTEQGNSAADESRKTNKRLTEKLFEGLTAEEIDDMLRLTEKLTASLDAMDAAYAQEEAPHGHHRGFCGPHGFDEDPAHERPWHHRGHGNPGDPRPF